MLVGPNAEICCEPVCRGACFQFVKWWPEINRVTKRCCICFLMNRSPDVRTLLVDRCLSKALAKAAICFVTDMIRSGNAGDEQPSYFHGMQHFPRVARRVLLIGTSSSTSVHFLTSIPKILRLYSSFFSGCQAPTSRDVGVYQLVSGETREDSVGPGTTPP